MARFDVQGGQFWLDGVPRLIQAGEFHYFRTPRDQWRHRLGLLLAAGFNTLATYIPWLWHQTAEDESDLDGHSHPMRDLAGFLDLAAEMGFLIIARPGPYIMAETINEGIPAWVFERYPEAAFVSQEGVAQNIASYMHPGFLRCVAQWYRAVFEVLAPRQVTRGGRIILIQLDNEMGMMPWVRRILDTNPDTMSRFAGYLRETYGENLAGRYPPDDLPGFLRQGILEPREPHAAALVEDYRRFYRAYLKEYTSWLWSEAKANGMEVPPVANIHGFGNGGKTFPIGLSQLVEVLELDGMISATDVYPLYIGEGNLHQLLLVNEMTKALQNRQQPLFSIEFQSGGNHDFSGSQSSMYDLHTRLCLSSGMRAVNHYLFFGGENDPILSPTKRHDWGPPVRPDGTLRRHYFRYPKLSRVLDAYGRALVLSEPESVTTIGFQLDTFMTEVNNRHTEEATRILTHQRDVILFDMIARGLALTHRPFDAVDLDRGDLDSRRNRVCWVMMDKQCSARAQRKLADYVVSGGKLILAGRMCVEDFHHRPCTILKDALGIERIESDPPFAGSSIAVFGHRDVPVSFVETYCGELGEVFAAREETAVGFVKTVGTGKVMMYGAAMTADALEDLGIVDEMATKMGCMPLFRLSDWADVRISRGEEGSFLFVNNYQDDPVETTVDYRGEALLGGHALHLPARSGLILPLEWQPREGIRVHYTTSEVVEVAEYGAGLVLRTAQGGHGARPYERPGGSETRPYERQDELFAELSASGYRSECPEGTHVSAEGGRILLHSRDGAIRLAKRP